MSETNNLMETLGIKFLSVSKGRVEALMPVEKRICQPFGILHGGATISLAESVAGKGSLFLCKEHEIPVGTQVSCNHISSAKEGEVVYAVGTLLHAGATTHIWNVDINNSEGRLISSARISNMILKQK
ncbi:MAG: PaaI family thioesterase [Fermentimonas sp.]|nr:PaaI family thioesterase [Fermentimonas sp.]